MAATKSERDALYYERHKEAVKARVKASYDALTPEQKVARRVKDRARPTSKRERKADQDRARREVIDGLGGACVCCGTTFLPHLTLDHVHGGGNAERQAKGCGGRSLIYRTRRRLRAGETVDDVQVLCWNCNWTKHVHGRCPCSDEGGQ